MPKNQRFYGYKTRYIISWILIIGAIIASISVIAYNNNAVMTLFGKGKIKLRTYDEMIQVIMYSPDTYNITAISGEDFGTDFVEYYLSSGEVTFRIEGENDVITLISGEIDLTRLQISQPLRLYSAMDNSIRPLCNRKDILAAEITILKFVRYIDFFNYSEIVVFEGVYDGMNITIERKEHSANLIFRIMI